MSNLPDNEAKAEIDDDVFEYEGGMKQCISGFGRNAIDEVMEMVGEACEQTPGDDWDAVVWYEDAKRAVEWSFGEMVRWCRALNGDNQRQALELAQLRAEVERLKTLAAFGEQLFRYHKFDGDVPGDLIQKWGAEAGVYQRVAFDPAVHSDPLGVGEPGCEWFVPVTLSPQQEAK